MKLLIGIAILFHLILPVFFLLWIHKAKSPSKLKWISIVLLGLGYILFIGKAGAGWSWLGYYWPIFFLVAFVPATIMGWLKRKSLPWLPQERFGPWVSTLALFFMTGYLALSLPAAFTAGIFPQDKAVSLTFPLINGTFFVGHGGSNELMNHHYKVPAQKYALDIVELNKWGVRAKGLMPENPEDYIIFGHEVLAPCSGEVLASESNHPDQKVPESNVENFLGNYLVLFCKDSSVLLAHLKQGSVTVKESDRVQEGKVIAEVGNTGNTSEPHLHIHAVDGRHFQPEEIAGKTEGIPMILEGEFFIRNDKVLR